MASSRTVVAGSLLLLFLIGLLLEIEGTPNGAKKTHADDPTSSFSAAQFYRGTHSRALLAGSSSCSSKKTYKVKKADTCFALLKKYFQCSQTVFIKYNNVLCINAKLYVGEVICLPPKSSNCTVLT
eukprot:TRINITY_DN5369_c0_g2_i2.p3 TRINITY_DN5369_c0_g2~~TRINITY_DN5369_c0_g2_i2.p3  ORF type:complete len:126 (+),score=15.06 TRINITY_DN5369_c0_g2_i2:376-753(+)